LGILLEVEQNIKLVMNRINFTQSRKKFNLIVLFIFLFQVMYSQQTSHFSQYMFNLPSVNPSTTGIDQDISIGIHSRNQWVGMKNQDGMSISPKYYQINIEIPVQSLKSSLGVKYENNQWDIEKTSDFTLMLSSHRNIDNNNDISFGVSGTYITKSFEMDQMSNQELQDPLLTGTGKINGNSIQLGIGMFYKFKDQFWLGISGQNLTGNKIRLESFTYYYHRIFNLVSGYDFEISKKKGLILKPSFLVRMVNIEDLYLDVNILISHNDFLWGGLTYRYKNSVGVLSGFKFRDLLVGISYDYSTNQPSFGDPSSIEVLLKYYITFKDKNRSNHPLPFSYHHL